MSLVYFHGKPVENPHEDHHHISSMALYTGVFGALLFLTILTYLVSYADLGPASLPVAMVVACVKASLVVGFFMHLKYEDRFYSFLFAVSLLFIGIFFTFTLFDMKSGGELNEAQRIDYKRTIEDRAQDSDRYKAKLEKAKAAAAAPAAPAGGGH